MNTRASCREKKVLVSGKFNIVHPGHLRLFKFAKSCGDRLIVAVYDDDSQGVVVKKEDRIGALDSVELVDETILIKEFMLEELLIKLQPDIVVKGKEYADQNNMEKSIVSKYGGKLIFSGGDVIYSSRDLINREITHNPLLRYDCIKNFVVSSETHFDRLLSLINQFSSKKGLVIGEVILDEYISCNPLGMSQEDPTIVVTPLESKSFLGGAGIVAAHIAGLGAKVDLLTIVGEDATAYTLKNSIQNYNVNAKFVVDISRPSILKQRYTAGAKTLLRVNHLLSHEISDDLVKEMLEAFKSRLDKIDFLIFSDFNYGGLPQKLVDEIVRACVRKNIPIFSDSQSSSQYGNVGRFKKSDIVFATEKEARLAINDHKSGLQVIANALLKRTNSRNLFLKLGAEGLLMVSDQYKLETELLHALNSNPVDVAGAGDALLATSALCSVVGCNVWESGLLGSVASGIQVSRIGNTPVLHQELVDQIKICRSE